MGPEACLSAEGLRDSTTGALSLGSGVEEAVSAAGTGLRV